jgi:hypothetical protein|nr:hypothetical protein [Kofleriaceae bacterium]
MRSICSCALLVAWVACGDNQAPPPDAGPDFGAPSNTFPATLPPIPQIVNGGGAVLTDTHVVPVFFAGDPDEPLLEDFLVKFSVSSYWPTMVGEYGVTGTLTIDPSLVIPSAPLSDADLTTFVQTELGSATADTLDHTVYLLHYAKEQTYVGGAGTSCESFAGFHTAVPQQAGSGSDIEQVAVALAWGCDSTLLTLDDLDVSTIVMSHELVEAATDPIPGLGWSSVDRADSEWALHFGGEVGDMCEGFPRRIYRPGDVGYFIQRTWSNAEAAQFHDPCVPHVPDDPPFFAAVPIEPDTDNGVRATDVALDGSATIPLDFLSDGGTGDDWIVEVLDEATLDGAAPQLEFALDRDAGQNGEHAHLTITPAPGAAKGLRPYRVLSTLGGFQNVWFGVVDLKAPPAN